MPPCSLYVHHAPSCYAPTAEYSPSLALGRSLIKCTRVFRKLACHKRRKDEQLGSLCSGEERFNDFVESSLILSLDTNLTSSLPKLVSRVDSISCTRSNAELSRVRRASSMKASLSLLCRSGVLISIRSCKWCQACSIPLSRALYFKSASSCHGPLRWSQQFSFARTHSLAESGSSFRRKKRTTAEEMYCEGMFESSARRIVSFTLIRRCRKKANTRSGVSKRFAPRSCKTAFTSLEFLILSNCSLKKDRPSGFVADSLAKICP